MPSRPSAESIGRLYDQFGAALYRYAVMILADPAAAADAVQQVFVSLLRSVRSVGLQADRPAIEVEEWYLRRAVRNECYSMLRRARRDSPPAGDAPLVEPIAGDADPDLRLMIEQVLRTLPAEQREVVHLKVFEGFTFQEIASMTDESINTVASRYRYAMDKLRAQLGAKR